MDEKNLNALVDEALRGMVSDILTLEAGSEEQVRAAKAVAELLKLKNDQETEKAKLKAEEKALAEQNKDRIVRIGTAAAELVVPMIFYGVLYNKGLKFEETGTIVSKTVSDLIRRIKLPW